MFYLIQLKPSLLHWGLCCTGESCERQVPPPPPNPTLCSSVASGPPCGQIGDVGDIWARQMLWLQRQPWPPVCETHVEVTRAVGILQKKLLFFFCSGVPRPKKPFADKLVLYSMRLRFGHWTFGELRPVGSPFRRGKSDQNESHRLDFLTHHTQLPSSAGISATYKILEAGEPLEIWGPMKKYIIGPHYPQHSTFSVTTPR